MKKILIISYSIFAAFTVIGFAIFSFLSSYNALFCLGSLFVSLMFLLTVTAYKIDPVYKITLMMVGSAIGIITYFLSMFMPLYLSNNIALFVLIALVIVEAIALSAARFFSKFA